MIVHLVYFVGLVLSLPLLPIVLLQAQKVRRTVPRLPEASKGLSGSVGMGQETIKFVALGESTVAGVGVEDHADGVIGHLARVLSKLTGKRVTWKVIAKSGYTARQTAEHLVAKIPGTGVDIIVVGLGGNDTFAFNSPLTWQRDVRRVISGIRIKHEACPIVFANMPPVGSFPAFPRIMQMVLGSLIKLHGWALKSLVRDYADVYFLDQQIKFKQWAEKVGKNATIDELFSDGVHPSSVAYSVWGREIGECIVENRLV